MGLEKFLMTFGFTKDSLIVAIICLVVLLGNFTGGLLSNILIAQGGPIAPRKLRAKLLASGNVRLKWKFPARRSDATVIEVQMKAKKKFKRVAQLGPRAKKLVLKELGPGEYVFRVRARGPSGPSEWSNERSLTVPG